MMQQKRFQVSHGDVTIHVFADNGLEATEKAHRILHPAELSQWATEAQVYDEDTQCFAINFLKSPYIGAEQVSFTYWAFDVEKQSAEANAGREAFEADPVRQVEKEVQRSETRFRN
jgi:hypothetical protein